MNLQGFEVRSNSAASGGAWIQTQGSGTASYLFSGAAGAYELQLTYFDESDGVSRMGVYVNGQELDSWRWNAAAASNLANNSNCARKTSASRRGILKVAHKRRSSGKDGQALPIQ